MKMSVVALKFMDIGRMWLHHGSLSYLYKLMAPHGSLPSYVWFYVDVSYPSLQRQGCRLLPLIKWCAIDKGVVGRRADKGRIMIGVWTCDTVSVYR